MKLILLVGLALVAVAVAAPVEEPVIFVEKAESDSLPDGNYVYGYQLNNGIRRVEVGRTKEVLNEENKPQVVLVVSGKYAYLNNDGAVETIEYTADENGYRASGPAIPTNERR